MDILTQKFYNRDTVEVARDLLGKQLVRVLEDGTELACRITETEAYVGRIDKACHAYNYRRTARTETLFAPPGTAYIYLIYGMYHCLNFVTEPEGEPCAVLIRGAVPVANRNIIAKNRFGCKQNEMSASQKRNFLNGPGKLCQGLALTRAQNGLDLTAAGPLYVCGGPVPRRTFSGKRIGIDYAQEAVDFPWRFWAEEFEK
ncbi:MAG: DNA-3-methyladenine glycosylase [Lawsonibacter sp.]|nr:DNA-3-methyladenine glycosylase [Lawsonibacter sp.]MCI8914433.1 DNA-3-methyladenine glycosylase [Lawsonibacter sp.]